MKIPPDPNQIPGEWQEERNQYGGVRRYRMIGNVKEYETMVKIDGVEIPQSEIHAYNQRKKAEAKRQAKAKEKAELNAAPRFNCPLKDSLNTTCVREKCALYDDGCLFAQIGTPKKKTAGLHCPLTRGRCRIDCAMYHGDGCTLTALLSRKKEKEEV